MGKSYLIQGCELKESCSIHSNKYHADMGYHMKLSLIMGCISREKQRSYYDSSTFSTTNPPLSVLRLMEQLRLQT